MTTLRITTYSMPAADLGVDNPLPVLAGERELHALNAGSNVPQAMVDSLVWGHPPNILPYTRQDGYNRALQPRDFRVAVLENETLCATFLLELGGRLWSIFHKPSGRELLSVNPIFQPANLAIRNAWFSGGVEWNIGVIGHSPFTCEPLFAGRVEGQDGPILRMWEWERVRRTPFQIDAWLPDGSPVLFVRVRIINPHDHDTPMYWWSNIAVPETPQTRVVVPAQDAFQFGYGRLDIVPIPHSRGLDVTYPTNIGDACDFFFRLPDGQRRWITALDGAGRGLVQVSTDLLRGRKLFVWGMNPGGRRWQEFLSVDGQAYIEIQAGLPRTQMEYLRMPARSEWAWTEAYGLLEADPSAVHGPDWVTAQREVEQRIEQLIPRTLLDGKLAHGSMLADVPPVEIYQRGSGWGALERLRRTAVGEPPFCPPGLTFDDASLTEQQEPWLALLRGEPMPAADPPTTPRGFMVQTQWREMLERQPEGAWNWFSWLHLGLLRHQAGDRNGAALAWQNSLAHMRTPWALRNLAALAQAEGNLALAAELYLAALELRPDLLPLAVECGSVLIEAGRAAEWLARLTALPVEVRQNGRICLLEARSALATGDFATVERILAARPVVADLREGDTALSDVWFEFHLQRLSAAENRPPDAALRARVRQEHPVPAELDFRMRKADEL
jgi:tetratricopeptide (TPR) repeat protein